MRYPTGGSSLALETKQVEFDASGGINSVALAFRKHFASRPAVLAKFAFGAWRIDRLRKAEAASESAEPIPHVLVSPDRVNQHSSS